MTTILLDNTVVDFSTRDLPCLIHGKPHEGSSRFTVGLAARLYMQGEKLVFLCGFPMARAEFLRQIGQENLPDSRVIFFAREESLSYIEYIHALPDIQEWVLIVKNIELFGTEIFEAVRNSHKILLSGNIDACRFGDELLTLPYRTKVYFSKPRDFEGGEFPSLPEYEGYVVRQHPPG